jgi:hypothetical protein
MICAHVTTVWMTGLVELLYIEHSVSGLVLLQLRF